MRRGTILVSGLLMASTAITAVPQAAEARPLILNSVARHSDARRSANHRRSASRHGRRSASRHPSRAMRRMRRPAAAAAAVAAHRRGSDRRDGQPCHREPGQFPRDTASTTASTPPPGAAPEYRVCNTARDTRPRRARSSQSAITERPQPKLGRSVRRPGRPPTKTSSASRCGRRNTASGLRSPWHRRRARHRVRAGADARRRAIARAPGRPAPPTRPDADRRRGMRRLWT